MNEDVQSTSEQLVLSDLAINRDEVCVIIGHTKRIIIVGDVTNEAKAITALERIVGLIRLASN